MIEFRDVHKHFGPLHVLRGIDLSVNEREVVVVIGPSGSGKSTMIRTINRLEPIDSGSLVVDGLRVHEKSVDVNRLRRDVGMVFQSFNLFPHLTVVQNIMLAPMRVRGLSRRAARERAERLLAKVGIPEKADVHPARLSGGQQQRVAIARALVTEPTVLLADEPTGNLDSRTSEEILELMRHSVDSYGQTMVMVTHDAAAAAIADRILFLADGRIVDQLNRSGQSEILAAMSRISQ